MKLRAAFCICTLLLFVFVSESMAHYRVNSSNSFLTVQNSANLDNERALAVALGLLLTDTGANGALTVAIDYTLTLASNPALPASRCAFAATGIICEGSTVDANETLFTVTDPTADRTINFPNLSGTVVFDTSQNAGTNITADLEEEAQIKATAISDDAADAEVLIGTGAGTGSWSPISGDATLNNAGVVAVADDSHNHTNFPTLKLTTPVLTPAAGAGITVNNAGELRTQVYKVTVAKEAFIAAAQTVDITVATLPAKAMVQRVIADVTEAYVCGGVCTTATLSATTGKSAGGNEYLASFDVDAAIATFGDADAELGTSINAANGPDVIWTAGTVLQARYTSGTGNFGDGAATHLTAGSTTFYVFYTVMP